MDAEPFARHTTLFLYGPGFWLQDPEAVIDLTDPPAGSVPDQIDQVATRIAVALRDHGVLTRANSGTLGFPEGTGPSRSRGTQAWQYFTAPLGSVCCRLCFSLRSVDGGLAFPGIRFEVSFLGSWCNAPEAEPHEASLWVRSF